MSSEVVIRLRGVGKTYPVVDTFAQRMRHLFRPHAHAASGFRALQGIDLDVRRGEAIGVIGTNGAGKSTLLQIITGIIAPSEGTVEVNARIAALLELGAGFNPEFTGLENIRLNASLLGLGAAEIDARMQDIVAFAEIGDHVHQQVKTYSSGMFMRLAFAVAAHTDPDVLIVDEALSVGDVYFQRKCFKRIEELRQRGCTLLFVTHAIDSVLQLCDRGVVLDRGRIAFDGAAQSAVKEYLRRVFGNNVASPPVDQKPVDRVASTERDEIDTFVHGGPADAFASRAGYNRDETRLGDGRAVTCDFLITSPHGTGPLVAAREPFRISVRYYFPEAIDRLIFGVRVCQVTGQVVYSANTLVADGHLFACEGGTVVRMDFDMRCALLRGHYFVTVGVSRLDEDGSEVHALDRRSDAIILGVTGHVRHAEGTAELEATFTPTTISGALRSG